jgi:two-component system, cell cycle response regulator
MFENGLVHRDRRPGSHTATRIVLIEDDPDDAFLFRRKLEDGWPGAVEVTHFETLDDARSHLTDPGADCVLLDLGLPDGGGVEAVRRIRSSAPGLPVVVLTGIDDDALAVEAVAAGAQDYLVKGRSDAHLIRRATRHAIERKHAELELLHQALHDPLTGLPNRPLFMDRLSQALARMVRAPAPAAILFVDIDRLKPVNDEFGHAIGDALLDAVAERLVAAVRPSDTVARFGGDQFTVLCEKVPDEQIALAIAERVAGALTVPFDALGRQIVTTASIGIVLGHSPDEDPARLVSAADAAMYRAKGKGGARAEIGSLEQV